MTVVFRDSVGVNTGVNQINITVAVPGLVEEGDLMIAIINLGPRPLGAAPAGWNHVAGSPRTQVSGLDNTMVVQTRIADAADAAGGSYQWSRTVSQFANIGGVIVAFSGALELLDFLTFSGDNGLHPNNDATIYVGTDVAAEVYVTALGPTGSYTSGPGSILLPSPGFVEHEDVHVNGGVHLQVQSGPSTGPGPVAIPLSLTIANTVVGAHNHFILGLGALVLFPTRGIINVSPGNTPAGPSLALPISFSAVGPENIESLGVAIRYIRDPLYYMLYETDGFMPQYAPDSSVANMGTTKVDFTISEFGGWRGRIAEIRVFGIDAVGVPFVFDVLKGANL